jgi:hypothetical protein
MGRRRRLAELALLALVAAPGAGGALAAGTIYCCEDAGGRRVCGDLLPPACYGRAYREIDRQGTVRREVAAPLSAEEIARRQAQATREREQEIRALKQRRLDHALLETYPSLAELDTRRERVLGELDQAIAELRQREAELLARRKALDGARGAADELRGLDGELASQRSVIAAKVSEREAVRAKFDEDRRRYVELTATSGARAQ